ncbi:hypothetical protein [Aeromonas allosaccharophila]
MIAITAKHTAPSPAAAVAYLVRHGYINVKKAGCVASVKPPASSCCHLAALGFWKE